MAESASLLTPEFLLRLEQLELISRKIFAGRSKGERRSKRKGQSVEFADYRNYVIGDDLRFLDWNLFARLDRLFLRLFFEEEDLHFYVLIDSSASMGFGDPTKIHYAKQVAAALGFVALINLDRVRIEGFNDRLVVSSPPFRGRKSLWQLLSFLNQIDASGSSDLTRSLRSFTLKHSGKGVVLVLSDFMDKQGYETGLRYLLTRQMDVYAIQILSQEELDPDLTGDVKLVDVEDSEAAEITVHPLLLRRYHENLKSHCEELQRFCTRRGIHFLTTGTDIPFDRLVLTQLRQKGLIR